MARCHRIGQTKEVKVYRLVSRDTYEQQLFETASRKYGLDEAILGFAPSGGVWEGGGAGREGLQDDEVQGRLVEQLMWVGGMEGGREKSS
jgi:chromodomain-helicase-DNA-binding protein 7